MRISDWSSDVCSSDLVAVHDIRPLRHIRCGRIRDAKSAKHFAVQPFPMILQGNGINAWGVESRNNGFLAHITEQRDLRPFAFRRSEEHTSELQSLMRISYDVFCLKKKKE